MLSKIKKYTILSILLGLFSGLIIAAYLQLVTACENYRINNIQIIVILPVVGVIFLYLYNKYKIHNDREVELPISRKTSFNRLIITIVGTILSHLGGASIGRENTSARASEDISEIIANFTKSDKSIQNELYITAMAVGLAGTFGVPIAAIILVFEIIKKPRKSTIYMTIIACFLTYIIGKISQVKYPRFTSNNLSFIENGIILSIIVAFISLASVKLLQKSIIWWRKLASKLKINSLIWNVISGILVLLLVAITRQTEYLGISSSMQLAALTGSISFGAFFLKYIFTVICLGSRYQGGIITPAIDISLALGASLAMLIHNTNMTNFLGAIMLVGFFASLSNAPITSTVFGISFFGFNYTFYFAIVALIVYLFNNNKTIFVPKKIK